MIVVFCFSMPRKLRLYTRKHRYRSQSVQETLVVSIPLTVVSLPVSLQPLTGSTQGRLSLPCTPPAQQSPDGGQPIELAVSLPLSFFLALPLASLSQLHSRLVQLGVLPSGWSYTSSGAERVTICRIVHPPHMAAALPRINFTLAIEASWMWKLYFYDQRLEVDCCPTLQSTPPTVKSPADVVNLVSVIESSQVCVGNPDERFLPLVKRHQGLWLTTMVINLSNNDS